MKTHCQYCSLVVINGIPCHETGCYQPTIYVVRGRQLRRYRVWSLDVWGNARQGFEVNDRSERGTITVPAGASDARILRALKDADLLGKHRKFIAFRIDGDERTLSVDHARTLEPIYQLEAC